MMKEKDPYMKAGATGLAGRIILFGEFLREKGFGIFQSKIHDALRSLQEIDISRREDFFSVLRVNMSSCDLEWVRFPLLFEEFWVSGREGEPLLGQSSTQEEVEVCMSDSEIRRYVTIEVSTEKGEDDSKGWLEGVTYSPVAGIGKKDFGHFDNSDILAAQLALRRIMVPFRLQISRRLKRSKHGQIDFRRVMRKSFKSQGTPMEFVYRAKKKRLKRLVILADVSGSMDRYASFVMPFLLSLIGVGPRVEAYVFSTSLVPVTFIVRHFDIDKALERIANEVPDWSGGTRIGHSLHQLNQRHSFDGRTVVVILSDGWDLGGKELLKREMATLSSRAHSLVWLNPLAGDPDYEPMCRGMKAALPYVDYFLPADSLSSLIRVGRLLSKIMAH